MADSRVLSCFFLLLLITDSYFLIPGVIAQIYNPTGEPATLIEILSKQAKQETEKIPVIAKTKISDCSM